METQGVEPWSRQGNRRAFYMLRCDWDCRESVRPASRRTSSLGIFVSLRSQHHYRNQRCESMPQNPTQQHVGSVGQWHLLILRIKQPWRSYIRQLLCEGLLYRTCPQLPACLHAASTSCQFRSSPETCVKRNAKIRKLVFLSCNDFFRRHQAV